MGADTDSDTLDLDTLESDTPDLRALPVSMPLTCPCPATTTTGRGRLRLSPTSDTVSDTPELDTLELDSRALPVSTLPMSPCLVLLVSDTDTESTPAMSVCAPTILELPYLAKKLRNL